MAFGRCEHDGDQWADIWIHRAGYLGAETVHLIVERTWDVPIEGEKLARTSGERQTIKLLERAEKILRESGRPILELLKPPAGAYALFHHQSFALERVADIRFLFLRMLAERKRLGHAARDRIRLRELPHGEVFAQEGAQRRNVRIESQLLHAMRLDFESLYVFGAIFLDQWSLFAGYLAGVPEPETMTFFRLAQLLERSPQPHPALQPVAVSCTPDVRWLQLQMRTFRNRFVEHADRPWQRGTTMPLHGLEFRLFLPSPPGWIDDQEAAREIRAVLRLAPKWLQNAPENHWEKARALALLERIVDNIGEVSQQADRDKVAELVGKAGITSPSFEVVVHRLARFAEQATSLLLPAALAHPANIQLGPPRKGGSDLIEVAIVEEAKQVLKLRAASRRRPTTR